MEPGEMRAPMDQAAANGVVHQRRDGCLVFVYRIILGKSPKGGVWMKIGLQMDLRSGVRGWKGIGWHPAALLQTNHFDPCLG